MYSKAYQTVVAGRVRENEAIAFYGQNKVSCGRVTAFVSMGGQKQPTIVEEANEFVGKNVDMGGVTSTKHNYSTGKPPAIQVS
jgi:hypothetical protein